MSRAVTYRTEIVVPQPQLVSGALNIKERIKPGSPCFQLLRAAVQKVADRHRGLVVDEYLDCNGRRHECLLGVRTPEVPRAVGVNVEPDGRVVFVYDAQPASVRGQLPADPKRARQICDEIAQTYATFAVRRAMQARGFHTVQREGEQGSVVEGVRIP